MLCNHLFCKCTVVRPLCKEQWIARSRTPPRAGEPALSCQRKEDGRKQEQGSGDLLKACGNLRFQMVAACEGFEPKFEPLEGVDDLDENFVVVFVCGDFW